jgi:hypothetical protein
MNNNLELLCDEFDINLYKINGINDDIDSYLFDFKCKEDINECDIIKIINNNQLFDLIYNLNNNIITKFDYIENKKNILFLKIKEIDFEDKEDNNQNKKVLYLCLKEEITKENDNKIIVNYKNYEYSYENLTQININSFDLVCERIEDHIKISVNISIKIDIYDISIIDNDAIMIIMKVLFKNLKKYIEP